MPSYAARTAFLRHLRQQENDLAVVYAGAIEDIDRKILKLRRRKGDIDLPWLEGRKKAIRDRINELNYEARDSLSGGFSLAITDGAKLTLDSAAAVLPAPLLKAEVEAFGGQAWTALTDRVIASTWAKRLQPGGMTLSNRLWKIDDMVYRGVVREIKTGIITGKSPAAIANSLTGVLQQKEPGPARGIYRSPWDNLMRVTRSEMQNAQITGAREFARGKEWIMGYRWNLSAGHLKPCECEDLAGQVFPPAEYPAAPHPHCLCYHTTVFNPEFIAPPGDAEAKAWVERLNDEQGAQMMNASRTAEALRDSAAVAEAISRPVVVTQAIRELEVVMQAVGGAEDYGRQYGFDLGVVRGAAAHFVDVYHDWRGAKPDIPREVLDRKMARLERGVDEVKQAVGHTVMFSGGKAYYHSGVVSPAGVEMYEVALGDLAELMA